MNQIIHFVIIDDDLINNQIVTITLKKFAEASEVRAFTFAREALAFIEDVATAKDTTGQTIIFLDINMPAMSGWEFLKKFEILDASVKVKYKIYVLSSSIDHNDFDLAKENKNVRGYIVKPLTKDKIQHILKENE